MTDGFVFTTNNVFYQYINVYNCTIVAVINIIVMITMTITIIISNAPVTTIAITVVTVFISCVTIPRATETTKACITR